MATGNNSGVSLGNRRGANKATATETVAAAVEETKAEAQQDTGRREDRGSRRGRDDEQRGERNFGRGAGRDRDHAGLNSTRKARRENNEPVFLNQSLTRVFDQTASKHSELMMSKFKELVEAENLRQTASPFKLNLLTRQRNNVAYDVIILSRNFTYSSGGAAVALAYLYIVGSSRGSLADIRMDDKELGKYTLPNIPGNTPDDRNTTTDRIQATVEDECKKLFGSASVSFAGVRVIEADAELHADNDGPFIALLGDGGEAIMTFDALYSPNATPVDYANAVVGDNGYSVSTRIDYNPEPLFSSTNLPIHRNMVLTVGTFTDDGIEGPVTETELAAEVSAYMDVHYGQADYSNEPCLLPIGVITNIRTELGGNLLDLFLLALFNFIQIKDDFQYLPAFDWRKKDDFNDLSVMGYIEPELFDQTKAGPVDISSTLQLFDAGKKLFIDGMEIAIDIADTDAQTLLSGILSDAVSPDSDGYNTILDAMDRLTDGKFSDEFDRQCRDKDDDLIVIDSDNLQIGGNFRDKNQQRQDIRKVGFLAVAAHHPNDIARVEDYEDTTIGGAMSVANALRTSLDVRSEIVGSIKVTSYIRRYTFGNVFMSVGLKTMREALLVAPIDGSQAAQRDKGRYMSDLRSRGVDSRSGRRSRSDTRGRRD